MTITITATGEPTYHADESVRWLLTHIDDWRERTEKRRRDVGKFHPSDLGKDDDEVIALFNGTAIQHSEPAQKLRIFDNGHGVHSRWSRYFKNSGLSIKHKKGFWMRRLLLSGTCDEIIAHPETGEVTIVELKSINPFGFGRLTAPHEGHIWQLHCYMAGLRIHNGIVLYESKGDQAVKLFSVPFDRALWEGIEARLRRLKAAADAMPRAEERFTPEVIDASNKLLEAMQEADGEQYAENDLRRAAVKTGLRLMS